MKYKVGDKVKIKSLDWCNENINEINEILCGITIFIPDMVQYGGNIVTISEVFPNLGIYRIKEDSGLCNWTDEMIEGLVAEETKPDPKFYIGDRVKWYNYTCYITDIYTDEDIYTYLIKHNDYKEGKSFAKWVPESELTFEDNEETPIKIEGKIIKSNEMIVSIDEYTLPDGYVFKDENGNVINATKIVLEKKKKEYPKTYEECYQVTRLLKTSDIYGYKNGLLFEFQKLLIARDAYWKLAGEELGLGKPWEPDWINQELPKYCIAGVGSQIKTAERYIVNTILAFPTFEMRDTFYKNFKELIEECKELL